MKFIFFTFILFVFCCSCSNADYYQLSCRQNNDINKVIVDDGCILLPTRYPLSDSIYVQSDLIIAEKDSFIGDEELRLTIFHKGDTLSVPGNTIRKKREEIKYSTVFTIKDDEFYLVSDSILERCQINLEYKSACLYSKVFQRYIPFNNVGLDFYKEEDSRYIYKAKLSNWIPGSFDELDYMKVIYNIDDKIFSRTSNEIYFSKEDIDLLLKPFKAYLTQK